MNRRKFLGLLLASTALPLIQKEQPLVGFIDEMVFTRGEAKYTQNFVAPDLEFSDRDWTMTCGFGKCTFEYSGPITDPQKWYKVVPGQPFKWEEIEKPNG